MRSRVGPAAEVDHDLPVGVEVVNDGWQGGT
jgi:hypothetical protein